MLISEWGSDRVAFFFAYKGWQYVGYVNQGPNWLVITLHTLPKIVDAPLTLILRMGQWQWLFFVCIKAANRLVMCISDWIDP